MCELLIVRHWEVDILVSFLSLSQERERFRGGRASGLFSTLPDLGLNYILKTTMQSSASFAADGASVMLQRVGLFVCALHRLLQSAKVGLNLQWELSKSKQQKSRDE